MSDVCEEPYPLSFNPLQPRRRKSREVKVGGVAVGADNPVVVQSMVVSDTMDTEAVVKETLDLVAVGCQLVRITAPTVKAAENLKHIKDRLLEEGCTVPLVADIHFKPAAAMVAADYVEKVRINPGNFADGRSFKIREYSDEQYNEEIERIEDAFKPLVLKCKDRGIAMRIGTNHGSLSDRIMNRYGDTPRGMVESALEFLRIAKKYDYHDIILSMKASNPKVMIEAYRMLAAAMQQENMDYPFHLGVTEAGDGQDGRIKSAIGIGSLLADGLGDTIRVSLTEDSIHEIPVADDLGQVYQSIETDTPYQAAKAYTRNLLAYESRETWALSVGDIVIGGEGAPIAVQIKPKNNLSQIKDLLEELRPWLSHKDTCAELIRLNVQSLDDVSLIKDLQEKLIKLNYKFGIVADVSSRIDLLESMAGLSCAVIFEFSKLLDPDKAVEIIQWAKKNNKVLIVDIKGDAIEAFPSFLAAAKANDFKLFTATISDIDKQHYISVYRQLVSLLDAQSYQTPVLLSDRINGLDSMSRSQADLLVSSMIGHMLCDGVGKVVELTCQASTSDNVTFAYTILQSASARITRTDYVACPSCGRTLFDLQETTAKVKAATNHLKGVKIAIMGCIVNGPGEMADADFGYVGGAPGKINLYVGKNCVQTGIPSEDAVERLQDLIRDHGRWVEPA